MQITLVRSGDDIRQAVERALAVCSQCIVAGGGHGTFHRREGFDAGSRSSLAGGQLALYVVNTGGRWRLLRLVWRILASTARRSGELALMQAREAQAREARIDTDCLQLSVPVDGEVESITTPLRYRIKLGALAVRVQAPER